MEMLPRLSEYRERYTKALERHRARNKLFSYKAYEKQLEFHANGLTARERLLMAGNQLGKTYCGAAETAMHLTGKYPDWWPGRRWDRPTRGWAGSVTGEVTRDTVQRNLIGPPRNREDWGTGMIPGDDLGRITMKQGVPDAIDGALVKHVSGGWSTLGFKSYDQGRAKWQGETLDFIWPDEEPPEDVYTEALTRTNATGGMIYITFTPLLGMSSVVRMFLQEDTT
jgi:phage terminase large subunit-like protein